jgi:N-acetylmuramoyl-L-alanine amidase
MKPSGSAARAWSRSGLLAVISGLALAQSAAPRITAVRFWSFGDVTRVAIETEGEAQYHAERIDAPDRLFIDLNGVRRQAGTRGLQVIPVGDRLLKQIRIAVLQPGVTRVVLDLTGPHEYSVSQLTYPDRIIVELRTAGARTATPPIHSVTGSQSLSEPPETAAGPEPPASELLKNPGDTPARVRKPDIVRAQPGVSPDSLAPMAAPPEFEPPPGKSSRAIPLASAGAPTVSAPEQAAPPLVPPAPVRREQHDAAVETAQAAKRDSNGDRSLIRALGLKLDRVVIDPGHGGHDTGTIGLGGLVEKDLVLDVAKRLGALITRRLGSEVIYTRADDTFIPLEQRTALANEKKADLFLSIHANSSRDSQVAGSETFYLRGRARSGRPGKRHLPDVDSRATDAGAKDHAEREGAGIAGVGVHHPEGDVERNSAKPRAEEPRSEESAVRGADRRADAVGAGGNRIFEQPAG